MHSEAFYPNWRSRQTWAWCLKVARVSVTRGAGQDAGGTAAVLCGLACPTDWLPSQAFLPLPCACAVA